MPGIILAIAWILLMAPKTCLINVAIRATLGLDGEGPLNIFSMGGLIFAQGIALVPFVFLLLGGLLAPQGSAPPGGSAQTMAPLPTGAQTMAPLPTGP